MFNIYCSDKNAISVYEKPILLKSFFSYDIAEKALDDFECSGEYDDYCDFHLKEEGTGKHPEDSQFKMTLNLIRVMNFVKLTLEKDNYTADGFLFLNEKDAIEWANSFGFLVVKS